MAKKYYAVAFGREGSGIYTNWDQTEPNVKGVSGVKYKSFPGMEQARAFLLEKGVASEEIRQFEENRRASSPDGSADPSRQTDSESPLTKDVLSAKTGNTQGQTVNEDPFGSGSNEALQDGAPLAKTQVPEGNHVGETVYAYVDGSFRQGYAVYGYGVVIVSEGKVLKTFSGTGSRRDYVTMRNVAGEVLGAVKAMEYAVAAGAKKLVLYFDYQGIESWARGTWKRNNDLTRGYHEFARSIQTRLELAFEKVKGHSGDEFNELADELAKQAVLDSGGGAPSENDQ